MASAFGPRVPFLAAGALFAVAALVCAAAAPRFRAWERAQRSLEEGGGPAEDSPEAGPDARG